MPQVINTNLASLQAQRALSSSQSDVNTSLQRLSSGLRINGAKDDAAGLAISERFNAQIKGLNQAARNANDATSLAQTAEGALSEVTANLQRMRELAVQSANATNSASDRTALQTEVTQLMAEIDRVSNQASFNGIKLLNGSFTSQAFQVGANASETVSITSIASSRTSDMGTFNGHVNTDVAYTGADAAEAVTVTIGGVTTDLGSVNRNGRDIAAALNAAGVGFSATAAATTVAGQTSAGSATAQNDTFTVNGVAITIAATTNLQTNRTNAVAAINAQSATTGVTAVDDGDSVNLTAADGRNITTAFTAAGGGGANTAAMFGLAADATTDSTLSVTLKTASTGTAVITGLTGGGGIAAGTVAIGTVGTALSAGDVTSVSNATSMITAVDAALDAVNSSRAELGAIQNRFDSIVSALQTSSENQSAARSRIVDADFAAETAALTRGQILQQAGIAVLAQANAAPQNVLALLQ